MADIKACRLFQQEPEVMPIVVMAHLRKICTLTLKASNLFTHAQCMRVHYDDVALLTVLILVCA